MSVKKHLRAQAIAEALELPCVYLVDSGGAFLPLQDEIFPDRDHFGRIFYNQARMSAKRIPQVACVLGSCTAGGAYQPAMSDEAIIVRGNGTIFLAGPPLVKAATGEEISAEALGGAETHAVHSGVVDHACDDEDDALLKCRELLANVQSKTVSTDATHEPPAFDADSIYGVLPKDNAQLYDPRDLLARVVDGSRFSEFKQLHGPTLVCGFGGLAGRDVGILANGGILDGAASRKGAHFVELCAQRGIPLLFLQNITGFAVGSQAERGGIARDGAKLVAAVSCANVPKITVLVGGSHGAGNYGMCGRAFEPDFLFSSHEPRRKGAPPFSSPAFGGVLPFVPGVAFGADARAPAPPNGGLSETRPRREPRPRRNRGLSESLSLAPRRYPNSKIGVMGAAQAASTLLTVKQAALAAAGEPPLDDAAAEAFAAPVRASFEAQASPFYATARLWDDGVIDPKDTRAVLAKALAAVASKPRGDLGRGVFRM